MTAMATIHEARIMNGHSFLLRIGERRGNTTASKRSAAIKTTIWVDTIIEVPGKKCFTPHKIRPKLLLRKSTWSPYSNSRTAVTRKRRSDMAMLAMKKLIGFLLAFILYTINPMMQFPTDETTKIKQKAEIAAILADAVFTGREQFEVFVIAFISCQ